jgi:hypothetical protein
MHRREALQRVAVIMGGTVIGADLFLTGCKTEEKKATMSFSQEDIPYLDEIAETIIPTTDTPGAKAAEVGKFMTVYVTDCYDENNQKIFHEGMVKINDAADKKFSKDFIKLTAEQKHDLLVDLDKEQRISENEEEGRFATLFPVDEGIDDARLFHLKDWRHASFALRRNARTLRRMHSLHQRRKGLGLI